MARILAVSSFVARGRVGNSIAVPVLEAMGHEVWPVPTIMLSTRPGLGAVSKRDVPPELLTDFVQTYSDDGVLRTIDAVLSGYLPSAGHVVATAAAVAAVKSANTAVLYLCDPVMGDDDRGLYIAESAAAATRDRLAVLADALTPNLFELQWLCGRPGADAESLMAEHPFRTVALTSSSDASEIENLLFNPGLASTWRGERLPDIPNGTGDLFSALFLGHLLNGVDDKTAFQQSCDQVDAVVRASIGQEILQISGLMTR
ncbi:MAG: bifunctional hydroxymethylpyrimidine kinase/phosphomethylpyrimidine kinase [Pseudomonadota bacterium]